MPEVRTENLLLRVGGRTMARHGVWAVAGSRRGLVEVPITFSRADASTCATYIDRDGIVRLAAANVPRIEWVDLDGDGIRETPGLLIEGGRSNAWLWSDDQTNGVWVGNGLTSVVGGDADPMGGTSACHTVENLINTSHIVGQNFASATDNTRQSITWHAAKKERTWAVIRSFPKDGVAKFSYINLATGAKGTIDASHDVTVSPVLKNGFYRITMSFDVKSGGSTPSAWIGGATGDGGVIFTGDGASGIYVWRGQHEKDVAFASSPIKTTTAAVTRAADSFTIPFNFGPIDLTILARVARPVHADASGDIGLAPGIWSLPTVAPGTIGLFDKTSRSISSQLRDGLTIPSVSQNIPAGAELKICTQIRNLRTGGIVRQDVGSGFSADSSALAPITAFGNQTLKVGNRTLVADEQLFGVLLDLMTLRGLFTYAEATAVP